MTACTEAGCDGTIAADGYCDTCGVKPSRASAAAPPPAGHTHAAPPPSSGAGAGSACSVSGCGGTIAADGYCDTCGKRAVAASGLGAPSGPTTVAAPPSIAAPTAPGRSARMGGTTRRSSASRRTGATRRLGAGLVSIPSTPSGDPAAAVMSQEKINTVIGVVAEDERYCSTCGQSVGRALDGREGRIDGFCSNCRTPFDFRTNAPTLGAGELVAGQYEVLGPIAHGGMGWIYLGRDNAVSNRWVVLKGLLNEDDPDAAAAAVAERQFLAQIEHGNIVNIYNFATHLGRGYIVMEYVGGESLNSKLKDRRKANGGVPDPLPPEQAIAYMLGILPAFGYLHGLGLVYNDLKPANVMSVGDDVKLIDVGAVMRIDDQNAAIFGTPGFQAPEVARLGPSVASDLYTVGRTLAVLMLDFMFHQGAYEYAIPLPREQGLLRTWESLHRFLLKSTAEHPDDRFQTSGEMTEQLTGVLLEIVAVTEAAPRPVHSRRFGGDQLASLLLEGVDGVGSAPDWRALPPIKSDPDDPEAAYLEDLDAVDARTQLQLLRDGLTAGDLAGTPGVTVALAVATLELGDDPKGSIETLEQIDAWDWRVGWLRGLRALATGDATAAAEHFSATWTELPGELAPRLGVAMAAEQAGEFGRAAELYQRIIEVDNTFVSAAFGLARCRGHIGDRDGAVAAYRAVPTSSAMYADAQVASARTLAVHDSPEADDLHAAAATVSRLQLDAQQRSTLAAEILERALAAQQAGTLSAAPGVELFGNPLDERGIRLGLESTYRELARLASDPREKFELVDKANAVRPRSLV